MTEGTIGRILLSLAPGIKAPGLVTGAAALSPEPCGVG
jgi:hypothetical protein